MYQFAAGEMLLVSNNVVGGKRPYLPSVPHRRDIFDEDAQGADGHPPRGTEVSEIRLVLSGRKVFRIEAEVFDPSFEKATD